MYAEALALSVKVAMESNVYMFDNQIRVQSDGGGIGVQLTGVLAEIKMIKWCKKFYEKLCELKLENDLLERFVDDITVCPTIIPPGWKYKEGEMMFIESEIEKDEETPEDARTMNVIQSVANKIDPIDQSDL